MDMQEAMRARHSVRAYEDRPLDGEARAALEREIAACNEAGDLRICLLEEQPELFRGLAGYGKFTGVRNCIALVGKVAEDLNERAGYYGERLVLEAQRLGLNTCWVALTFSKRRTRRAVKLGRGEKLVCVIAVGYGKTQGAAHKSKTPPQVCAAEEGALQNGGYPAWFERGVEAALLAPTAVNQQKFLFTLTAQGKVRAEQTGGYCRGLDLGILKYHFELGAGKENFGWEN